MRLIRIVTKSMYPRNSLNHIIGIIYILDKSLFNFLILLLVVVAAVVVQFRQAYLKKPGKIWR